MCTCMPVELEMQCIHILAAVKRKIELTQVLCSGSLNAGIIVELQKNLTSLPHRYLYVKEDAE